MPEASAVMSGNGFVGRWKLDLKQAGADVAAGGDGYWLAKPCFIDIGADGAAMLRTESSWFVRWTSDGETLSIGELDGGDRKLWLQMLTASDGTNAVPAPRLMVSKSKSRGAIFGGQADDEEIVAAVPLISEGPAVLTPLTPAQVAGEWQLSYERTEQGIRAAQAEFAAAGFKGPLSEYYSFERELKSSMSSLPRFVFRVTNADAPPASPESKEGRMGTGELQANGQAVSSFSFDVWHDTVVMYQMDDWHGIKPNRSFVRIVDGKLLMENERLPLVLERVK